MHILSSCLVISEAQLLLANPIQRAVSCTDLHTRKNVISDSLFMITKFHHSKTIQCPCGYNRVFVISTQ